MINEETKTKLQVMGMEEFADGIESQQRAGTFDAIPFEQRFDNLVDYVYEAKYQKKVETLRRRAKLRFPSADVRDIYYEGRAITKELIANLSTCNYMFSHIDISIEGCCGSGKTWLGCALANAAIKQGKRVLYIRFPELLEKYHEDKKTGKTMMAIAKKYVKYDLMVIDEYMMYDLDKDDLFFLLELTEKRYDKTSTIYCSQYNSDEWYGILGNSVFSEAVLDRIVHNLIKINLGNANFRDTSTKHS